MNYCEFCEPINHIVAIFGEVSSYIKIFFANIFHLPWKKGKLGRREIVSNEFYSES